MKIMTVLGTRPEIIRLSAIIKTLDTVCDNIVVHTGQNYDPNLSDVFFKQLELRQPDVYLDINKSDTGEQVGLILSEMASTIKEHKPNRFLVLGDTNSGLSAIMAARMGVPVFHVEAGNRCYDNRVPEEVNRRIIDHSSDILMPYTHRAKENLLQEGIPRERIFVVGNPIYEVWQSHLGNIRRRYKSILDKFGLVRKQYFVVTMHRTENVDDSERLRSLWSGLNLISEYFKLPMIVSLHPRTRSHMTPSMNLSQYIQAVEPMGFLDFAALLRSAKCVITDSGTVQEECAIFRIPSVTIRNVTERPETIECGSNILTGHDPHDILDAVRTVLGLPTCWEAPPEYCNPHTSKIVTRIIMGHYDGLA